MMNLLGVWLCSIGIQYRFTMPELIGLYVYDLRYRPPNTTTKTTTAMHFQQKKVVTMVT